MSEHQEGANPRRQRVPFETMNLQVATRLQLLVHRDIRPIQYFSTLIGYVHDEYLLVKLPQENGKPVSLRDGEKLSVRVFSGMQVCTFNTTVLRCLLHPFHYAHLDFPQAVYGASLRTAMRIKVDIPARVSFDSPQGRQADIPVLLSNLSVAGAQLQSEQALCPEGDKLRIRFTLVTQPGNYETQIDTDAVIRNRGEQQAPGPDAAPRHTSGIEFGELDPAHRLVLQHLTYETLVSKRQNLV